MARSAADATRFTATGPVVSSKGSTIDISKAAGPAPTGETPQQKVVRLREAARRVRSGQESTTDRILSRGRVWADRAHRFTVVGLLGLSVICGGVAVYSTVDMMMYNRRKRSEFITEQEANYGRALIRAIEAEKSGTLTPDLALVLNKERAVQQYEAMIKIQNERGMVTKFTDWVQGNAPRVEKPGGAMGFASDEIKRIAEGRTRDEAALVPNTDAETRGELMVKEAVGMKRTGNAFPASASGMLDRMAQRASDDASKASRSWLEWARLR